MVILKRLLYLSFYLIGSSGAYAVPLFKGGDISLLTSAGVGRIYLGGVASTLRIGDRDSSDALSGNFHFNLEKEFSPSDSSNPDSPFKQNTNLSGGGLVDVSDEFSIGLDLDHLEDSFENLYSDGIKISLLYSYFQLAYRYARSTIRSPFNPFGALIPFTIQGAEIFQSTIETVGVLPLSDHSEILADLNYSFFTPSVSGFSGLLSSPGLSSLANFQDTLQNFELWSLLIGVNSELSDSWTLFLNSRLAHIIIGENPLIAINPGLEFSFSPSLHAGLSWNYSFTPAVVESIYSLEIRYSWK